MMLRAIVLVLCLISAGAIAAYTYYSSRSTGEPVYIVPSPVSASPPYPPKSSALERIAPDDLGALTRALQRELKRVGCYNGEISGAWTAATRLAMKTFVERVNAALPVDKPDPVLLSLVEGHRERACEPGVVAGSGTKEPPPDNKLAVAGEPGPQADAAPDAKPTKRPRQYGEQPPKVVRDFMRALGIK